MRVKMKSVTAQTACSTTDLIFYVPRADRRIVDCVLARKRITCSSAAAGSMGEKPSNSQDTPIEPTSDNKYAPFPRLRERNSYRLLGLPKDASMDEVLVAKNFLIEEYRWHEPSKESIELAFDNIIQERLKDRNKLGFGAGRDGYRPDPSSSKTSLNRRISNLFDPTITVRTLINEGVVFVGLALWALTSRDQSFPLTGAFAYSVFKLQSKRVRNNPEGPFLAGNPVVGAVLTTVINLALGCALMAALTTPLAPYIEGSIRHIGGFAVVMIMGILCVYLK
ncbi:hypothetical protein CEUSTIGMA_g11988.t1 [Chlamydomonas eustigma]|uniref:Uncharacterized protein n=1 Tax=Chlamydomonas eustigma TaxID=1157962 RepID=A0A250XNB7_9CHLO|nr:hypothetical protein CEUSTIGMA_g11988.t1 [Chlamydomonas eustigma]|eukprot:GAX84567.1 hypothetical protein CEUSTIGMA_g11988.t1 [Chlamydomonas eustigma]